MLGFAKRQLRRVLRRPLRSNGAEWAGRTAAPDSEEAGLSPDQEAQLRAALVETYFKGWEAGYLDTDGGRSDLSEHVSGRYRTFCRQVLPWIARVLPLSGKDVIEIGCGTGSGTAGIARSAGRVVGFDIEGASIAAARKRCEVLGLRNVELVLSPAEKLLEEVRARSAGGCDVCLLYAVLEHQTLEERLATLRTCWELLRPGGILVVNETPNRLLPSDPHTSQVPFFQMLPDVLALQWAGRSQREAFRERFSEPDPASPKDLLDLARWGRGVSHHEFELALGLNLAEVSVADSYQVEMLRLRQLQPEELALKLFSERAGLSLPASFTRSFLDLILRKPGGAEPWVPLRNPRSPSVRANDVEMRPDGTLTMTAPGSSIEFAIEGESNVLTLGVLRHPWSGALRIDDQSGGLVHREELTREEGGGQYYLDVGIPKGTSRLRLTPEVPRGGRAQGSEVWIHYLGLR